MQAIHNFRDFGGYLTGDGRRIKRGLLYRSGSLAAASDADLRRLSALGIRTVCDLRTQREKAREPDRLPEDAAIKCVHLPIKVRNHDESGFLLQLLSLLLGGARRFDNDQGLIGFYREYVTDFSGVFSQVIRLAAERDNLPLLIHCTAGKDRTGFACALLQLLLGVSYKSVMEEYLLSNTHLHGFREEQMRRLRAFTLIGVRRERFLPFFEARREFLEAAHEQISHDYGTVRDYARDGLRLSEENSLRLKNLLIEASDPAL
jgi:protein-tyrosine phosphatase